MWHLILTMEMVCCVVWQQILLLNYSENNSRGKHVRKFDQITDILEVLYWLPVAQSIKLKVLLFDIKCLCGLAPTYLSEMLTPYIPSRTLRSSSSKLLTRTKTYLNNFADHALSFCGLILWNGLPQEMTQCKTVDELKVLSLATTLLILFVLDFVICSALHTFGSVFRDKRV